jgi:twitching motility protein PilT
MAGIDQILSMLVAQGANELRLGTDREPQMFVMGARCRLSMAATPEFVLRQLLGDILSKEREQEMVDSRRVSFEYEASGIGQFHVSFARRKDAGFDVTMLHSGRHGRAATPTREQEPTPANTLTHLTPSAPDAPRPSATTTASATNTNRCSAGRAKPVATERLCSLVERAFASRASDIHLTHGEPPYLRIDGRLQLLRDEPAEELDYWLTVPPEQRTEIENGTACDTSLRCSSGRRLRASVVRVGSGMAAALRLLPAEAPRLANLELPLPIEDLAELPHGLVLLCGATGSGKSSTLAALGRHALEKRSIMLVTLEDPVEFPLHSTRGSLVRQREVGSDVSSFAAGLRDALRGDPDVIMVGELRDRETIQLALTAAETGHLVLASLHSGSASSCIERLVDAYASEQRSQIRVQLADCLRAVVVQRLLPRARGPGRVVATEILRVNRAAANVIREGKTAQLSTVLQSGRREGMLSLERCLADYVKSGVIELEQARAAANDPESLAMNLSG